MDSTHTLRKVLLRRRLLGVAMISGSALAVGCGAKVAVDLDGGIAGVGGAGGATIGVGVGGAGSNGGCALTSSGAGAGQMQTVECFATPPDGCPEQYYAVMHIVPSTPCVYLVSVDCGPIVAPGECCYVVTEEKKPCGDG